MKEKLSLAYLKDMVDSGKDLNEVLAFVDQVEKESYLMPVIEKPNPDYDNDFRAYIWDTCTTKVELDGITVVGADGANGGRQHMYIKVKWDGALELVSFTNSEYAKLKGRDSDTPNVNLSDYVFKGWAN